MMMCRSSGVIGDRPRLLTRLPMLIDVISASPRPEFQLVLEFKNGECRRFDM